MSINNLKFILPLCLVIFAGNAYSKGNVSLDLDDKQHVYTVYDTSDGSIIAYGVAKDIFEARQQIKEIDSTSFSVVINDKGGSFISKLFDAQAKIYYYIISNGEPPALQAELFLLRIFKQMKPARNKKLF